MDIDGSGKLDKAELKRGLLEDGWEHDDKEAFEEMMEGMDEDKDGQVSKEEFIYWYLNKLEKLYAKKIEIEDDINFIQVRDRHIHAQESGQAFSQPNANNWGWAA